MPSAFQNIRFKNETRSPRLRPSVGPTSIKIVFKIGNDKEITTKLQKHLSGLDKQKHTMKSESTDKIFESARIERAPFAIMMEATT